MEIGKVTHFFGHIGVAVIALEGELKIGDKIHFSGHGIDCEQAVDSMQINHRSVTDAVKGQSIGLKTKKEVKVGCTAELVE